jgi:hypothetical protein
VWHDKNGIEHPERYSWWLNELDSLGISTLQNDGIKNRRESSDLTDAVKADTL